MTYLILKTTFDGILQEANRLAIEQDLAERSKVLKSELLQLRKQFERGRVSEAVYSREEKKIVRSLSELSQTGRLHGAKV